MSTKIAIMSDFIKGQKYTFVGSSQSIEDTKCVIASYFEPVVVPTYSNYRWECSIAWSHLAVFSQSEGLILPEDYDTYFSNVDEYLAYASDQSDGFEVYLNGPSSQSFYGQINLPTISVSTSDSLNYTGPSGSTSLVHGYKSYDIGPGQVSFEFESTDESPSDMLVELGLDQIFEDSNWNSAYLYDDQGNTKLSSINEIRFIYDLSSRSVQYNQGVFQDPNVLLSESEDGDTKVYIIHISFAALYFTTAM